MFYTKYSSTTILTPIISLFLGYYNNFLISFISCVWITFYSLYVYKQKQEENILDFNIASFITFYVTGITIRNITIIYVVGGFITGVILSFIINNNNQNKIMNFIVKSKLKITFFIKKNSIYYLMYIYKIFYLSYINIMVIIKNYNSIANSVQSLSKKTTLIVDKVESKFIERKDELLRLKNV